MLQQQNSVSEMIVAARDTGWVSEDEMEQR